MVKGQKAKHAQKIILATGDNEQSITYLVLHIFQVQLYFLRVTTDLEKSGNLKETSESQGIWDNSKSQGILLSEIHFQPS